MKNRFQAFAFKCNLYWYAAGKIYAEGDAVGPVNIYGSSKLAGEVGLYKLNPVYP
jgi:hypothetical protein